MEKGEEKRKSDNPIIYLWLFGKELFFSINLFLIAVSYQCRTEWFFLVCSVSPKNWTETLLMKFYNDLMMEVHTYTRTQLIAQFTMDTIWYLRWTICDSPEESLKTSANKHMIRCGLPLLLLLSCLHVRTYIKSHNLVIGYRFYVSLVVYVCGFHLHAIQCNATQFNVVN